MIVLISVRKLVHFLLFITLEGIRYNIADIKSNKVYLQIEA